MLFESLKHIAAQDLAERYLGLQLIKRGNNYVGLCPFHTEKTPSLTIFADGRWKCFGCNSAGDGVDLIAKALNISLIEAAKRIASDYGIYYQNPASPEVGKKMEQMRQDRELAIRFNEWRKRTFEGLSVVLRACNKIMASGPDNPGYMAAARLQPYVEFLLDVLNGSPSEQVSLFFEFGWSWAL